MTNNVLPFSLVASRNEIARLIDEDNRNNPIIAFPVKTVSPPVSVASRPVSTPSRSSRSRGRWNQLSTYKTHWTNDSDSVSVTYHRTEIVKAVRNGDSWDITLNNGGFWSVTTKRKMNQAANQFGLGFGVYQRKGEWFVTANGETIPFDSRVVSFSSKVR